MIAHEEIRQLSLHEKLALLESLWAEISIEPHQVDVPQWHKDILDSRQEALEKGQIKILEWDEAKKQISQMRR